MKLHYWCLQFFLNSLILSILIFLYQKLLKRHFSKTFLKIILDYLWNRSHLYNLIPTVLLLCIQILVDPKGQYANNSTIYQHFTVNNLKTCFINIEKDLSRSPNWSTNNNLLFSAVKTKSLLLTLAEMKSCHKLDEIKTSKSNVCKSNKN